jgi:membrane-bound lytic murein transglycosylase D
VAGVEPHVIKQLNPELVNSCTPPNQEYSVRVPNESVAVIEAALANGELGQYENFRHHTVKRGDSVARIARRYRISKDVIFALNKMSGASDVRLGQTLIVPGSIVDSTFEKEPGRLIASARKRSSGRVRRASFRAARAINDAALLYTVRQGDTLYDISRRYSVTVTNIKDWNAISRSNTLQPGRRLKLYVRNDSTRI